MASTADILRKIFEVGGIATETFGKVKSLRKEEVDKAEIKAEEKEARGRRLNQRDREIDEENRALHEKGVSRRINARAKLQASRQTQADKINLNIAKENAKLKAGRIKRSETIQSSDDRFNLWLQGKLPKITDQEKRFFENKIEGRGSTGKAAKERDFVKETKKGFSEKLDTRNKIARDAKNRGKDVEEGLREAGEPAQIGSEFDFYNSAIRQFVEGARAKDSIGAALGDPDAQDRFTVRQQAGGAQPIGPRQSAGQPRESLAEEVPRESITEGVGTIQGDQQGGAPKVIDITPLVDPDALSFEEEQLSLLLQKERDGIATEEEVAEIIRLIQLVQTSQIPFQAPGQ